MLAYQAARAVWPELAILDPIVGGVTLLLVAHQVGHGRTAGWTHDPKSSPWVMGLDNTFRWMVASNRMVHQSTMLAFVQKGPTSLHD